jgi:predicted RNase H-like nuclease
MITAAFTGFDSAWSATNRGAIAHVLLTPDSLQFMPPQVAGFDDALNSIELFGKNTDVEIIGIDQPLIVPNYTGYRPVERVFQPLLCSLKGAIQPAHRGKVAMFGDSAPIWPFLRSLSAEINWPLSIRATSGRLAIEIYPAAALLGLFLDDFLPRKRTAKYNPGRRKTFSLLDWKLVCGRISELASQLEIAGIPEWADSHAQIEKPRKADQDCLDAVICVLITHLWWKYGYERSLVVGDFDTGYIVTPTNTIMTASLVLTASTHDVSIHLGDVS